MGRLTASPDVPGCEEHAVAVSGAKGKDGFPDPEAMINTMGIVPIEGDTKSLVGSYVAWFQKWARMFRSGKSYGAETNLGIRIEQHGRGALLDDAESQQSNFYQQFPSKKGKGGTEGFRKGYFEDITFFLGTAFRKDTAQQPNNVLVKDVSEGGILKWQKQDMELLKTIPQGNTALEKQAHMVGFLLEVFDDLMIEPKYNVSESSGMDPFMRGRGPRGASTTESRRLFQ